MRLTLRTLLAYMDEILEPGDREELAKTVESSEFAHDLIHRTKDTMRRLRLSAPQVLGSGIGLDPNTVAEYLDNVLPPDSVADFERICLESDVHLAEVASAHHVLTMVLGEPAEVDPVARQRMYAIPTEAEHRKERRLDPAHVLPTAERAAAVVTPPPSVYSTASVAPAPAKRAEAIPDYLRANSWTRHRLLLAMCAAVLVIAVGFLFTTGLGDWLGGKQQVAGGSGATVAGDVQSPPSAAIPEEIPATPAPVASEPPAAATSTESDTTALTMSAAPPRLQLPAMGGDAASSSPPAEVASTEIVTVDETAYGYQDTAAEPAAPTDATDRDTDQTAGAPDGAPDGGAMASIPQTPPQPAPPQSAIPTDAAPREAGAMTAGVATGSDAGAVAEASPPAGAEPVMDLAGSAAALEETPEKPADLGTYFDGKNVLLHFDAASGAWLRMAPHSPLHPGDKLLALPAFYPKLTLTSGLHLKLAGGTLIGLDFASADSSNPAIDVAFGKLVIVNTTNDENNLRLTLGTEVASSRLAPGATIAVDVQPRYAPGSDPRTSPSPLAVDLYVRDGDVVWVDADGSQTIAAPSHWSIEDGAVTAVSTDAKFPAWIDEEPIEQRSEKLFGAPAVESALDATRPVGEQLLELYQSSSRREVKSLVARSSVYAGLFVPFVEALRDSDQKGSWKTHIDTLRSAMSLGPESAGKLYQTLVDQRGPAAADDLYQMLCGYGPEQIGEPEAFRAGLAAQLVEWMENDSLDYRVLAVQDMADITGMRLMPNPAGTPTERARGIRLWRQRLKAGEVSPASP
jgi:hypothetical protein